MNIQAISTPKFNNTQQMNFTGNQKAPKNHTNSSTFVAVKVPVAALIAMSPLMSANAQVKELTPEQIVLTAHQDTAKLNPKTKILDVKTFFDVNGQNYIVKTKSTDGDDSNFESVTVSQATPNSRGAHLKLNSLDEYTYMPFDDSNSTDGVIKIEGVNVEDIDSQQTLIGNEEFIEYIKDLAFSPANSAAIGICETHGIIKTFPSGRITHNLQGNRWEEAQEYCPKGAYMGEKTLDGDHGKYTITIYNSDNQDLTAEEFTLKKDFLPEMKIDKMIKVKANFMTDKKEPVTYETYQFNLRDDNDVTTIIYDKTLGEYMERVCKSTLYNKKDVPFEKAEVEKDYKISASNGKIYLNDN